MHAAPGAVPRALLAFSQPTEEGSYLAESFTGRSTFLVYGVWQLAGVHSSRSQLCGWWGL